MRVRRPSLPASVHTTFRPLTAEQAALFDASPYATLALDTDFRIRYVNTAAARIGDVEADALIGHNVWERFPELEGSTFHRAYAAVLSEGRPRQFEEYRGDNDTWVSVYAYPADGGVVAVLDDVTERRRAERALRESERALARGEETLRIAQEAANIGSFERDLVTHRTRWSPQLMRMLGVDPATYDESRATDQPRMDFVHPTDRELFRSAFQRVMLTGEAQTIRVRFIRANGEIGHMLSSAVLARSASGEPQRMIGTALDITEQVHAEEERLRLEAQVQQAQKLESLGILAGGIAHDFNNLLVGILGNASLALLDLSSDAEARRSVEEIEQAAQRAADLTRQLLAYAGKGRFVVESVDPSALVGEMASLLRTAVSRNAQIQLDLPGGLPNIEVDATQFRQVVMNLITNASDAIGDRGGTIVIRTGKQEVTAADLQQCVAGTNAAPGSYVFVEVADTGNGMDDATRARIFDPFFSTKFTGRGLGLAATLGIVRGHRGAILVTSAPGEGTSFRLYFLATTHPARVHVARRDSEWRGKGRVLIVDDEDSVRAVSGTLLKRRGFEVHEAEDGFGALATFRNDPDGFALVLLDLTMPGMGGEATFSALRELRPNVHVVLMSGYNEQEVTRMFEGRGLAGFLQKPFRAEELYATVAATLGLN